MSKKKIYLRTNSTNNMNTTPHSYYDEEDDEQLSMLNRMKQHSYFWYTMVALVLLVISLSIAYGPRLMARYMPQIYELMGGNGGRNYNVRGMTPGALPPIERKAN